MKNNKIDVVGTLKFAVKPLLVLHFVSVSVFIQII